MSDDGVATLPRSDEERSAPPRGRTPAEPPLAPAQALSFHSLFARERFLLVRARHRDAIRFRWSIVLLTLFLAFVGRLSDSVSLSYTAVTAIAAGTLLANAGAVWLLRLERFREWHFWAMMAVDALLLLGVTATLQQPGYLVLPLVVVIVAGHSLGMPLAGHIQLLLASVAYPLGRYLGLRSAGIHPTVGVIGLETLFLIGLGWLAAAAPGAFTSRVRRLRAAFARVEHGDFTVRLPYGQLDDIGFLSVSVNHTLEVLSTMVREIQDQSQALATVSDQLAAAAYEIQHSARQIGNTTGSLAEEAGQQLDLVGEARRRVEEAAAEGRGLRDQAAATAGEARAFARTAADKAEEAERAADLLVHVGEDFNRLGASMQALDSARGRIDGFAHTIEDIARQTDLLALNAAIEAARAGSDSRGFAVVAEEVRKLAIQSARSAAEVSANVDQVQAAIEEVRHLLDDGNQRVAGIGEVAAAGRRALTEMVGGFDGAALLVEEVSQRLGAQAAAMRRLREGMARIDEITRSALDGAQQNAAAALQQVASMEELAASSRQLAMMAEELDTLAARFRVDHRRPDLGPAGARARREGAQRPV